MRGNIWSVFAAAIGGGLFLMVATSAARPSSPAGSTESAIGILAQFGPFIGLVLFVAAIATLVNYIL